MHWEFTHFDGYFCHDPIIKGAIICLLITVIFVFAHIIDTLSQYVYTRKGLRRIRTSIETGGDSNQPVRLQDIKFKKAERFSLVSTILSTFMVLETLRAKDNFVKQWELRIKNLGSQVERRFLKKNLFLVLLVLSIFSGLFGCFHSLKMTFVYSSISGSSGISAISGGIVDSLVILMFASISGTLAALGYLGTKSAVQRVLAEITKLEIRLLEK